MTVEATDPTRYRVHSGPHETEAGAREEFRGVRGMVKKGKEGWYVYEMYYSDESEGDE